MIEIALLGFGVVGQGTASLLAENEKTIAARLGEEIRVKYILDIRDMPDSPFADRIVHDYNIILSDPDVKIVAEMIGGSHPAYDFCMQALEAGKSVVTSNKEVVATFGDKLLGKAEEKGVRYLFEASVGGGIPVLRPLVTDLSANKIREISGILNGTTNYILTAMAKNGTSYEAALKEAQEKGYAEANPSADVDGIDACRKIVILSALASGKLVPPSAVHTVGIGSIRGEDVKAAANVNMSIKLLGRYIVTDTADTYVMVSPFLIPEESPLHSVDDVNNGIIVDGNFVGKVMFYGRGAGAAPTASAVVSDIINLAAGESTLSHIPAWTPAPADAISNFSDFVAPRYLAFSGAPMTAVQVIFGEDARVISEENGEIALLLPAVSGTAHEEDLERLVACGARILSSIPVYE